MPARILIVEDNTDSREMLGCLLKIQGFAVLTAVDGQQALEIVRDERPDLIITDLDMPMMNGIELIKRLRGQAETRDVPVLVITACRPDMIGEALEQGASASVRKPIDTDRLINLIRQIVLPFIALFGGILNYLFERLSSAATG